MILDKIVKQKKIEVKEDKEKKSKSSLEEKIKNRKEILDFKGALKEGGMSLIAEIKKASPSKGVIREDFKPVEIARKYQKAGVSAISILTDREFFQGSLDYLKAVKEEVEIPLLRKDFIIDEYQIYQTKAYGADAILLIVAILDEEQLQDYLNLAKSLGLAALVEVHNFKELETALKVGADIIGINNRNLKEFSVDLETTFKLQEKIPADMVIVSESGIKTGEDVKSLEEVGVDAILVGESLMRSDNIGAKVRELIG